VKLTVDLTEPQYQAVTNLIGNELDFGSDKRTNNLLEEVMRKLIKAHKIKTWVSEVMK
jgi:hypothetical protein